MPRRKELDLRWLRSFLQVVRHGSFTRAAQATGVTQPAISTHMRKLEEQLGTPLLHATTHGIELTEAGKLLFERARVISLEIDRLEDEIEVLRGRSPGRLRVGASTTPGTYLLPDLFERLRNQHPGLEISCHIESTRTIEERLAHGEIDAALMGRPPLDPTLSSEPFAKDRIVLIAREGHPLSTSRKLEGRTFVETPLIMREPGSATREKFEIWLRQKGHHPRVAMELGAPEAVKRMVAAGVGIAPISVHAIAKDPASEGLALLPDLDPPIVRDLFLVWDDSRTPSAALASFMAQVRDLRPS